jgi:ATP-binding cassette subfamily C protein CydC
MRGWPIRRLVGLAARAGLGPRLVLAALTGAAASACAIGLLATSAWLISRAAQHPPVLELTVAIVGVRAFAIGRAGLRYGERLAGHDTALRMLGVARTRLYRQLERLAPAGAAELRRSDATHRLVSDVDSTVEVLVRAVLPYAAAVLAGLAAAGWLFALLPAAGLVVLVGLAVVAVAVPVGQHAVAGRAARRLAPTRATLSTQTVELLHGLPDLIAAGAVSERLAALAGTDERLRRDTARSAGSTGLTAGLVGLASGACTWLALWLGTPAVGTGALPGVLLATVVLTPLAVFEAVSGLPTATEQAATGRAALRRVFDLLDRPVPVPDPHHPRNAPGAGRLRLSGVTARWPGSTQDALRDVDLDLPPGRRVALVGPSGAGKSTVAALLVRFLDPVRGRVTLDGVDLRELAGDDVRARVALLDGEAQLFDTTIEENLRIGRPDASSSQLRAALRAARVLDWVDSLPAGLSTAVGEGGARVSGGQRRRLALARVLLRDAPILILDEPTEHLDEATAAAVTSDLLAAAAGRTVLLITHRPYGLSDVDEVVRLEPTVRCRT